MKTIQTWDFLVSRNYLLDYRTIVAPDFMCEARVTSLLAEMAEGTINPPETPLYKKKIRNPNPQVGDLILVYRITEAKSSYIEDGDTGILKDSFGREIDFIVGLVVRGEDSANLDDQSLEQWIDDSHKRMIEQYRFFWEWESPKNALPSQAITRTVGNIDAHNDSDLESTKDINETEKPNSQSDSADTSARELEDAEKFLEDLRKNLSQLANSLNPW